MDATEERGCLWVMPRAHKGGLFFHHPDVMGHYLVIPDEEFSGRQPLPGPVPKGGVLLLTNRTPHASFENRYHTVRWSLDLRYQVNVLFRESIGVPHSPRLRDTTGQTFQISKQSGGLTTSWDQPKTARATVSPTFHIQTGERLRNS